MVGKCVGWKEKTRETIDKEFGLDISEDEGEAFVEGLSAIPLQEGE